MVVFIFLNGFRDMRFHNLVRLGFCAMSFAICTASQAGLIANSINQTVKTASFLGAEVRQTVEDCLKQAYDSESGCQDRGKQMFSCASASENEKTATSQERVLNCKRKFFLGLVDRDVLQESVPKSKKTQ